MLHTTVTATLLPAVSPEIREEKNLHILVLEDSPSDATLIEEELKRAGMAFALKCVAKKAAFIREFHEFSPDIVLSDYALPQFSGLEALRYLREHHHDTPFILVTGSQSEEVTVECMKQGADDYILKSSLRRLPSAIKNAIRKKEAEHQKEQIEAELHRQRDLYETLLTAQSNAGIGFAVISAQSRRFSYVNEAFSAISGFDEKELLALSSFYKLIAPNELYGLESSIRRCIVHKAPSDSFETTIVHKDGHPVRVEITVKRPGVNSGTRFIAIVRDISERARHEEEARRAQEALHQSEERFRLLFEDVKDYAIFMIDPKGRVLNWNKGAERILGYRTDEILNRDFSRLYSDHDIRQGLPKTSLDRAAADGRIEEETWRVRKDRAKFWASAVTTVLRNDKNVIIGFSCIIRDLTERKQIEDQLRAQGEELRELTGYLESVRENERGRIARELHDELGQVLTALRMDLSILGRRLSKDVEEPQRGPLMDKLASISHLVETTIHATRRIVTELRPAVLDELGLMTAIQWQAQEFENRTGIRCLVSKLQRDIVLRPEYSTALFRILQETLTNVARHANATKVNVSIEERASELVLQIADNGKGIEIDPKKIRGKSMGILGMRERVRMMGGTILVDGRHGEGTIVTVRIPLRGAVVS